MSARLQTVIVAVVATLMLCFFVPLTQAQPGFLSIDCGSNGQYTDPTTNITWVPDEPYIHTGTNYGLSTISSVQSLQTLRYFKNNRAKNCYVLPVSPNQTYMVRATFLYTDFLATGAGPPTFDLEIEAQLWTQVSFPTDYKTSVPYEVILSSTNVNIYVCLAPIPASSTTNSNSSTSVPFISSLELRLLDTASMYTVVQNGVYLNKKLRGYLGNGSQDFSYRYPDDNYDRIWDWASNFGLNQDVQATKLTTASQVNLSQPTDMVPEKVVQNATTWIPYMAFIIPSAYISATAQSVYYLALYFAEIYPLAVNESRVFDLVVANNQYIIYNFSVASRAGGLYKAYELAFTNVSINSTGIAFQLIPTASPLGPILNGFELLELAGPVALRTFAPDASVINFTTSYFTNLTSWTGDPCVHTPFTWISCALNGSSPRITAVMLSSYDLNGSIPQALSNLSSLTTLLLDHNALVGTIPESFSSLTNLVSIHLNDNGLTGPIPAGFASLKSLKELFLENNNFTGIVPQGLLQNPNLTLRIDGNPYLCNSTTACPAPAPAPAPSEGKGKSSAVPAIIGATIGGLLAILVITWVLFTFCTRKRRGAGPEAPFLAVSSDTGHDFMDDQGGQVAKRYSLAEIIDATNNFDKVLGEGGFARVYYGKLTDGQEVAVKRLILHSSDEEDSQFFNEVHLLSKIHHKNLVSLIGYCMENKEQILIYEYMSNGTIRESLYGTPKAVSHPLDWKIRLNIALNSAQGLQYLHTGCQRPIIHRDVKTSNILLSNKMIAKVADFGLSKMTMEEGASHISTLVKGTAGYLDPEYFTKQQLTDKSDVFSFGIVLLELICGRPPINRLLHDEKEWNIGEWVRPFLQSGDIHAIIDKALNNDFNIESMWKVAETAMLSIEPHNVNRPSMEDVVHDLKEAIEIEENMKSYDLSSSQIFNDSSSQQSPMFGHIKVDHTSLQTSSNVSKSSILSAR